MKAPILSRLYALLHSGNSNNVLKYYGYGKRYGYGYGYGEHKVKDE